MTVLAFAVLAASCDSGSSDSNSASKTTPKSTTTSTAPVEPAAAKPVGAEAAVAKYLQSQGYEYAGDCADATLPEDKGMWCSTLVSGDATSNTKTYALGPVGESAQKQITVTRHGSAQLTPGYQVGVAQGNVGQPQQLTQEQLQANAFITSNLLLDQAAGIGNGLADLPPGASTGGDQTGGGGTGGTGGAAAPVVTQPPDTGGTQYPPTRTLIVDNPNVVVGGETTFSGGGCDPNEVLSVSFDQQPSGTITADSEGNFAGSLAIPPGTAPGSHLLTVQGRVCVLNANVNVLGANLAFTGSSTHTGTYVMVGVAAIVIGVVLVVGTRRRRRGVRHRSLPPPSSA